MENNRLAHHKVLSYQHSLKEHMVLVSKRLFQQSKLAFCPHGNSPQYLPFLGMINSESIAFSPSHPQHIHTTTQPTYHRKRNELKVLDNEQKHTDLPGNSQLLGGRDRELYQFSSPRLLAWG